VASFGSRLKQEREQRGVTLDDISLSTKIGTRMLRALEEEHFDQLPGGIFNKGFIRAYARTLGMDEEQAIADYLAATGATPPAKKTDDRLDSKLENNDQTPMPELRAQLEQRAQDESPGTPSLPWGTLAVALVVIALGFAAWGFYSRQSQRGIFRQEASGSNVPSGGIADQSSQPQASQPQTSPQPSSPLQPPPSAKPVAPANSVVPPRKPNEAGVSQTEHGESSPSAPLSTTAAVTKLPQPATPPGGSFLVSIKAREDSWISITVDGEVTTQRTLVASSQKSVAARDELVIRAGNVGALDFEFNGKILPPQGAIGEAKTLTFNAQGLESTPVKTDAPALLP
jgi:cytoskeleton protein RodZ